jgi:alpha-beta hydrolase superfamily lysophospholipase
MLVGVGTSRNRTKKFKRIVHQHYRGLSDFFDTRGDYVMIERIPYGESFQSYKPLQEKLTRNGFTVWLITEPQPSGHAEVVYCRETNYTNGIEKLHLFSNLPARP